jgi:ArsR family transcriptional regulator
MKRLSEQQVNLVAERGRALGDPTRVKILDVLSRTEQPVGQLAATLGCEPSMISKHLQVLFHAGLVTRRRSASTIIYSVTARDLPTWCRYLATSDIARGEGT